MRLLLSAAFLLSALFCLHGAEPRRIDVHAGDFDRYETIVSFLLPQSRPGHHELRLRRDREVIPLQVTRDGRATFILHELKKGQTATYELSPARRGDRSPVRTESERDGHRIHFFARFGATNGTGWNVPLLDYQAEAGDLPRTEIKPIFVRGAYLHPILTPSGRLVTDDFPPNHIHHHGVWWSWTKTEFDGRDPDFWNMGDAKGRVDFNALSQAWGGPVHAGFISSHRFVDLTAATPVTALNENWEVTIYAPASTNATGWIFDLVSAQSCAGPHALKLPTYRYGGLGIRGNRAWNGADRTYFLTSEGETDRDKGNLTHGRWCDMAGDVDGARVGIAILGHPDNFRAPQPMRLHPTEPFFNFAPQQAGDMSIEPGQVYRSRYRFFVHDGPPGRAELDRLWNDFAHPPVVEVRSN